MTKQLQASHLRHPTQKVALDLEELGADVKTCFRVALSVKSFVTSACPPELSAGLIDHCGEVFGNRTKICYESSIKMGKAQKVLYLLYCSWT